MFASMNEKAELTKYIRNKAIAKDWASWLSVWCLSMALIFFNTRGRMRLTPVIMMMDKAREP